MTLLSDAPQKLRAAVRTAAKRAPLGKHWQSLMALGGHKLGDAATACFAADDPPPGQPGLLPTRARIRVPSERPTQTTISSWRGASGTATVSVSM